MTEIEEQKTCADIVHQRREDDDNDRSPQRRLPTTQPEERPGRTRTTRRDHPSGHPRTCAPRPRSGERGIRRRVPPPPSSRQPPRSAARASTSPEAGPPEMARPAGAPSTPAVGQRRARRASGHRRRASGPAGLRAGTAPTRVAAAGPSVGADVGPSAGTTHIGAAGAAVRACRGAPPARGGARWAMTSHRPAGGPVRAAGPNLVRRTGITSMKSAAASWCPPAKFRRGGAGATSCCRPPFGLINLGQSPDERHQAELEAKIRSLLRGHYKIGVLGKGGTGKTTVAAAWGSVFAEAAPGRPGGGRRRRHRVRQAGQPHRPARRRARTGSWPPTSSCTASPTSARRVGSNNAGLFVLAGEAATARRRVLDPRSTGRPPRGWTTTSPCRSSTAARRWMRRSPTRCSAIWTR